MSTLVFLGGGRITAALVAGLRAVQQGHGGRGRIGVHDGHLRRGIPRLRDRVPTSLRGPHRIVIHDRNPEKLRNLARRFGIHPETSLSRAVAQADMLILAVRPADVLPLLNRIGPLRRDTICLSLAAGVPLRLLCRALRHPALWARAMPSPACRNGRGLTALAFDRKFAPGARHRVRELFARVGAVVEIPEREFDAFTVVYSTSQGYHALAARIRAARKIGLSPRISFLAAAHGLAEGVRALERKPALLSELLSEAATPGGIAAEVLGLMQRGGYERLVERAYRAGLARARRMRG